jgi:peptidoglycan biosynthesis protein MviN/MurJ (putative lipid II flippase)
MHDASPDHAPTAHLAIGGVVAVIVLNLLVRTFSNLGGVLSTLLVAAVVASGMALWFYLQHKRRPLPGERRRLIAIYGGILALLYLGLLGLMWLKDEPGPMGLFIFGLHYFSYPVLAWMVFIKRQA